MKIYGYSNNEDSLLELAETTISASPNELRTIAEFLMACADGIEQDSNNWEHDHYKSNSLKDSEPDLIVFNSEHE